MFTSRICAPPSTCWRATSSASSYCPARMSFAKRGEPVTFVRSPTFTKLESGRSTSGSRPESARAPRDLGPQRAAARPRTACGDRPDVVGRRAAAAADDVDEARARPLAEVARHRLRRLVEAAEGVRQPGVRVGAHEAGREARQLLDVGAHLARAERAVEPDREQRHVLHRDPERLDRLPGEVPPGQVGDRDRGDHRAADAGLRAARASTPASAALALSVSNTVSTSSRSAPPSSRPRACSW